MCLARICSLWLMPLLVLCGNGAHALTPPPPVNLTFYVGTAGCPAGPEQVINVWQDTVAFANIGFCASAPTSGTLTFTSSDANAVLPGPTAYNSLILPPALQTANVVFRTPGRHTIVARDVANNLSWTLTVEVLRTTEVFGAGCAVTLVARPPRIALSGEGHPIVVSNCNTTPTGVLSFASTDPLATLPPPRAYSAGPNFGESAGNVVFRTPGLQTLFLRDSSGNDVSVSVTFNVLRSTATANASVPLGNPWITIALTLLIAGIARLTILRRS
jgi:hypothetical protein